jgi:hypothetical protein
VPQSDDAEKPAIADHRERHGQQLVEDGRQNLRVVERRATRTSALRREHGRVLRIHRDGNEQVRVAKTRRHREGIVALLLKVRRRADKVRRHLDRRRPARKRSAAAAARRRRRRLPRAALLFKRLEAQQARRVEAERSDHEVLLLDAAAQLNQRVHKRAHLARVVVVVVVVVVRAARRAAAATGARHRRLRARHSDDVDVRLALQQHRTRVQLQRELMTGRAANGAPHVVVVVAAAAAVVVAVAVVAAAVVAVVVVVVIFNVGGVVVNTPARRVAGRLGRKTKAGLAERVEQCVEHGLPKHRVGGQRFLAVGFGQFSSERLPVAGSDARRQADHERTGARAWHRRANQRVVEQTNLALRGDLAVNAHGNIGKLLVVALLDSGQELLHERVAGVHEDAHHAHAVVDESIGGRAAVGLGVLVGVLVEQQLLGRHTWVGAAAALSAASDLRRVRYAGARPLLPPPQNA